jgi:hypothetical protein
MSDKPFHTDIVDSNAKQLVLEINDLVRIRTALSYGTGTSAKVSAESAISRKINSKVLELSKLVLKDYDV